LGGRKWFRECPPGAIKIMLLALVRRFLTFYIIHTVLTAFTVNAGVPAPTKTPI